MNRVQSDQRGIAHLALVVVILVVLVGIGAAGWYVMNKNKKAELADTAGATPALTQAAKAECEKENDKDICKFYSSWKLSTKYRMTTTDASGAKTVIAVDGDKSQMSMTGETSYDVITHNKTTYTKAGSVWYKQTIKDPEQDASKDYKIEFDEPDDSPAEDNTDDVKTTYKRLGKEACSKLTCFKYQVIDTSGDGETNYIWFDDKDYQLRRSQTVTAEGTSESTYDYENVTVTIPKDAKELAPNQYIVPGQAEPVTMPSAADLGM